MAPHAWRSCFECSVSSVVVSWITRLPLCDSTQHKFVLIFCLQGVSARVLYQAPSTAIAWSVYEFFKYYLNLRNANQDKSDHYETLTETYTTSGLEQVKNRFLVWSWGIIIFHPFKEYSGDPNTCSVGDFISWVGSNPCYRYITG